MLVDLVYEFVSFVIICNMEQFTISNICIGEFGGCHLQTILNIIYHASDWSIVSQIIETCVDYDSFYGAGGFQRLIDVTNYLPRF